MLSITTLEFQTTKGNWEVPVALRFVVFKLSQRRGGCRGGHVSRKAHRECLMPVSTLAGYQKSYFRNKICKAEIYSDWTDELLIPDTKGFKFILFFSPISAKSE